jgi:serine/threonine protein kinase
MRKRMRARAVPHPEPMTADARTLEADSQQQVPGPPVFADYGSAGQPSEPVPAGGLAGPDQPLIGCRYRLTALIGSGSMGTVWRAWDELLQRAVAVKEVRLPAGLTADEQSELYQRTMREARSAAQLNHQGAATVHDVVEESGRPWIVMELFDGCSLDEIIRTTGAFASPLVAEMGRQLLAALAAAHRAGVLHRDVKPANVLLTPDGGAVLTDFGMAAIDGDAQISETGVIMGTPAFMAPERVRNDAATPAADLWSLGATLYTAVEGKGPYDHHGSAAATMAAILTEDPAPPESAGPLAGLIVALLSRDPVKRPGADAAMRMLETAADIAAPASRNRQRIHPVRLPRLGSRSERIAAAAAAAVCLAIAVPATVWALNHGAGHRVGHGQAFQRPASDRYGRTVPSPAHQPSRTPPPPAPVSKPSSALFPVLLAVPSAAPTPQSSHPVSAAEAPGVSIDAGGPWDGGSFIADTDYSGGEESSNTTAFNGTIDFPGTVSHPIPQMDGNTYRVLGSTYQIPGLTPGGTYQVRLYFLYWYWTNVGERVFDVDINGAPVLQNFDAIQAAVNAGATGQYVGVERDFTATADSAGTITIEFLRGLADQPMVNAIAIVPSS